MAWADFLRILVQLDYVQNIFEVWPRLQAQLQSGEYVYWKDIPSHVAKYSVTLPISPIFGVDSDSYGTVASLLVAKNSTDGTVLGALGRSGLQITQPPGYITKILCERLSCSIQVLTPEVVHEKLQVSSIFVHV
jgi:sacsin